MVTLGWRGLGETTPSTEDEELCLEPLLFCRRELFSGFLDREGVPSLLVDSLLLTRTRGLPIPPSRSLTLDIPLGTSL